MNLEEVEQVRQYLKSTLPRYYQIATFGGRTIRATNPFTNRWYSIAFHENEEMPNLALMRGCIVQSLEDTGEEAWVWT